MSPQVSRRPASGGLLSGWKASHGQANSGRSELIAEQSTLNTPAVQGLVTGAVRSDAVPRNFGERWPAPVAPPFSPMSGSNATQPGGYAGSAWPSQPPMPFTPTPMLAGMQNDWRGRQPPFVLSVPGQAHKKTRRFPIWARVGVGALALLIVLAGGGAWYYEANFAAPVSNIVNQQAPLLKGQDNPNVNQNTTSPLSGGRINILLLGSDNDQKFQGGYPLAQTDIVVTINPATKSVGMLSIPRDLYVNVPGYGMMKLDEAYATGAKYLNNPVGLSRLTITQDFGIPINYYAWVGLDGFMKVVNTAGGVDVDVTHPIVDDVYPDDTGNSKDPYAYKRLYIAPGPQHLDGATALEYVRSRHADLVGDFGRSARQQQILSQLKTKLTSSPDIISQLPQLAQDMNGYLKTDMNLISIAQLMSFARSLDLNNIQRAILSPPTYSYAATATSGPDTGEDIFMANCAQIQPVIAKMFALGSNATCNVQANSNNARSAVASFSSPQQPLGPVLQAPSSASLQTAMQMARLSPGDGNGADLLGIRSLLDLLCLAVFESPIGLQV